METRPSRSLPRVTWDENVNSLVPVRRVIYSTISWLSNPILVIQHNMHKHIIHNARYPYWKSSVSSFTTEYSVQTPYSIELNWGGPKKIGHEVKWLNQRTYAALKFDLPISEWLPHLCASTQLASSIAILHTTTIKPNVFLQRHASSALVQWFMNPWTSLNNTTASPMEPSCAAIAEWGFVKMWLWIGSMWSGESNIFRDKDWSRKGSIQWAQIIFPWPII